jgi:hypothetical protein
MQQNLCPYNIDMRIFLLDEVFSWLSCNREFGCRGLCLDVVSLLEVSEKQSYG